MILTLSALGFPFNHFDPTQGDTMKSNYYSFLIGLAFIFICSKIFRKLSILKFVIFLIFILIFFLTLGFPKNSNTQIDFYLEEKIEISPICEIISLFSKNTDFRDCHDKVKKTCDYNIYSNDAQNILDPKNINSSINETNPILFIDDENRTLKITNYKECEDLLLKGQKLYKPLPSNLRPLPVVNMLYLLITITYIIYYLTNNLYKFPNRKIKK